MTILWLATLNQFFENQRCPVVAFIVTINSNRRNSLIYTNCGGKTKIRFFSPPRKLTIISLFSDAREFRHNLYKGMHRRWDRFSMSVYGNALTLLIVYNSRKSQIVTNIILQPYTKREKKNR